MSNVSLALRIPLETARQAEITKKVMEVDKIVRDQEITISYTTIGLELEVLFTAQNDKILRTVVNSTFESLKSLVELYEAEDQL